MEAAPPRAYLLVFHEDKKVWSNVLRVELRCYRVMIPTIAKKARHSTFGQDLSVKVLMRHENAEQLVARARAELAYHALQEHHHEAKEVCVLAPAETWRWLLYRMTQAQKFARAWKRLAKLYFACRPRRALY